MSQQLASKSTNSQWGERWAKSSFANYTQPTIALAKGQGCWVWDVEGRKYLDFLAGIAVCSTGHAHPKVVAAIHEQAAEIIHTTNLYLIPNQIELAEQLEKLSGLARAYFCNSGTEAIEASLKLARFWGSQNGGKYEFITTSHAFHGRTMGALTLTRNTKYHQGYHPLLPGVTEVPYNDLGAIRRAITPQTCAVILEPLQGEGGVKVPDPTFLQAVRKLCDETNTLLILDEVQTGIGRTGDWFAFQRTGIRPDIVALAKGLGSGFPIGAMLATEKLNIWKPGNHGTTFGGSPLACAVGLATIRTIRDEKLVENAKVQGEALLAGLRNLPGIENPRGQGLLCGFDLKQGTSREFVQKCMSAGLLLSYIGEKTVRIAPPLIVSQAEVQEALGILARVLQNPDTPAKPHS